MKGYLKDVECYKKEDVDDSLEYLDSGHYRGVYKYTDEEGSWIYKDVYGDGTDR